MQCPTCGQLGPKRQISPNWVECCAPIVEVVQTGQAPILNAFGVPVGARPVYQQYERPCGVRHHIPMGVDIPRCACGTFAIGLCRECDEPVCGDDSGRDESRRLCRRCLKAAEGQRMQLRREALLREQEEVKARRAAQIEAERTDSPLPAVKPFIPCASPSTHKRVAPDGYCWDCNPQ